MLSILTFLLAPLVTKLERWLGRIVAVLLVVALIFTVTGAVGYVLTRQLIDLAEKLPDYKDNIRTKLRTFKIPKGGGFSKFSATVEELKNDLTGPDTPTPVVTQTTGEPATAKSSPPNAPTPVVPVKMVQTSTPIRWHWLNRSSRHCSGRSALRLSSSFSSFSCFSSAKICAIG